MSQPKAYDPFKRFVDIVGATILLVVTLPIQGLVAVLIRLLIGSPVLFHQDRPGRDGEIFELVKFRTMLELDPTRGLTTDAQRMTTLGNVLRASSLDELPSLWNVVRGNMSLVGPRPLLVRYLERYSSEQFRRHEVRPGITGLAQVSGRNAISWDEKFAKDIEYVDKRSLLLDLKILIKTFSKVVKRDGISDSGTVTMTEFMGSNQTVTRG